MRNDYALHQLDHAEFEQFVVHICFRLLGSATIAFADGKDGGRDARFEGTAANFPNAKTPWSGKFIIQAKHTSNPTASCSDNDFCKNKGSILTTELPKVVKLKADGYLDNYLLFTNRAGPGSLDVTVNQFRKDSGIANFEIIGRESLHTYIAEYRDLVSICHLDRLNGPLRINPNDLKDIIDEFHTKMSMAKIDLTSLPSFSYLDMNDKNKLNQMDEIFFSYMKSASEPYFDDVDQFLKHPSNQTIAEKYQDLAHDFNAKIFVRRKEFADFSYVIDHLYDQIISGVPALKNKKRLISVFLHYMYFNCDLGLKK